VTKSLPIRQSKCVVSVLEAKEHIEFYKQYSNKLPVNAKFYEFGAGWDLIVPITYYAFGVTSQIIVDIKRLARAKLINDSIKKLQNMDKKFTLPRKPERYINEKKCNFLDSLKEYYGINYIAPCDARQTGLSASTIDCITSTNTLEHVNQRDIKSILKECNRILVDNGLMIFRIDYSDHYAYFDKNISIYNFLQYSHKTWNFYNPSLHYQNRLRHKDYLKLFHEGGFEVVYECKQNGTDIDIMRFNKLQLDKRFKAYSFSELIVKKSVLVLRKCRNNKL
jgi:SAM-dependent methyltransferase